MHQPLYGTNRLKTRPTRRALALLTEATNPNVPYDPYSLYTAPIVKEPKPFETDDENPINPNHKPCQMEKS